VVASSERTDASSDSTVASSSRAVANSERVGVSSDCADANSPIAEGLPIYTSKPKQAEFTFLDLLASNSFWRYLF